MSDDDGAPVKEKIYSTPEGKDKTRSKFKNILEDLELKMQKPKTFITKIEEDSTNSKLDTNISASISNNKNYIKDSKNKVQSQSNSKTDTSNNKLNNNKQNSKTIRKFNSFEDGSLKYTNKKGNNLKTKTSENNERHNTYNERNKTKKFIKINNLNTSSGTQSAGNLSSRNNHDNRFSRNNINTTQKNNNSRNNSNSNNSSKNKKEKLRPSTPGIRTNQNTNSKNNKNNANNSNTNINQTTPNIKNVNNKDKEKEKKNSHANIDPLYIPHIVKDPLDILRHQVDLILEQSNEDITNLSNNISLIDMEMESSYAKIHENYAKELQEIYKDKEVKLIETNNKYDFALYKMFKTYGTENNIIYDEMLKDKNEQISEIEQEFNTKKNQIKNNFNTKIEEIKKIYDTKRKEQEITNSKMIKEIKKKIYDILYEDKDNKKNENNKNVSTDNKKEKRKKAISMNKK